MKRTMEAFPASDTRHEYTNDTLGVVHFSSGDPDIPDSLKSVLVAGLTEGDWGDYSHADAVKRAEQIVTLGKGVLTVPFCRSETTGLYSPRGTTWWDQDNEYGHISAQVYERHPRGDSAELQAVGALGLYAATAEMLRMGLIRMSANVPESRIDKMRLFTHALGADYLNVADEPLAVDKGMPMPRRRITSDIAPLRSTLAENYPWLRESRRETFPQ